jgi:hypothetical protein
MRHDDHTERFATACLRLDGRGDQDWELTRSGLVAEERVLGREAEFDPVATILLEARRRDADKHWRKGEVEAANGRKLSVVREAKF